MTAMLKMAGGIPNGGKWETEYSLDEFIIQAEEYRSGGDVADQVYKVLNLMATTHPFYVLRVSEIRSWIESGDYDRIIRGEYPRRGDPDPAIQEDLKDTRSSVVLLILCRTDILTDRTTTGGRRMQTP